MMATLVSHREHTAETTDSGWTPQMALRYAWYVYLALLVIPFLLFLYVVWAGDRSAEIPGRALANRWFIGTVAYIVLVVPASFFLRSRYFQGYWSGDCVSPRNYFKGMLVSWLALEIGGLLSLTGCLVTGSFAPCILPALVAFMMFAALWPNGRAMICRDRGASDDPERYEEPR
jgi:hypothetical protein